MSVSAKELIAEATEGRKRKLYEPVLVRLFQTYDADESGALEADEVRQIMLDCIEDERKVLTKDEVTQFMRVIGGEDANEINDEELTISQDNFVQFIMSGILKNKKQLSKFAKRSPMHKKLYVFMVHLMADGDALERAEYQRNEASYKWFVNMIWRKYDKDKSGAIDVDEMKELLADAVKPTLEKTAQSADLVGGGSSRLAAHLPTKQETAAFMKSLDKNGNGSLDKAEFSKFVLESLQLSEDDRVKFASRSQLHEKLYLFLHSVFDHEDGPHKDAIRNAAATMIQKAFRRFLTKKQDRDLLNVVKAAEEFNFDSLLEATLGEGGSLEEDIGFDIEDELEMSGGGAAFDQQDGNMEDSFEDGEPDWLKAGKPTNTTENDDDYEQLEDAGFDEDDDDEEDGMTIEERNERRHSEDYDAPKAVSGFEEKPMEDVVEFTDNGEVNVAEEARKKKQLKSKIDDFVWNYVGATLAKKLSQIQDLFSTMDESGDGLLSKEEFEHALSRLGIHLNPSELELMFERMEVNADSHHSINFVQFHKSLHTSQPSQSLVRNDFTRCVQTLGISIPVKDIHKMYFRLCHEKKNDVPHNIFFNALAEEMYQARNPLLKKILGRFCAKVQRILQRLDAGGQVSVVSFQQTDVDKLAKMKDHEQESVVKRLQQALSKDSSKSARNTLSRILGTKKPDQLVRDPVKIFVGDYVTSILLATGMRVTELFSKLDGSGDGFLTHDELTRALKKMEIGKNMTRAELHCLHEVIDVDGDGEVSFKELQKRFQLTKDSRHISSRAFRDAMAELGFGELQDVQYENIYNAVNVEGDGRIYFEDLHSTLHNTDHHGIPLAAQSGDPNGGFDGTIPVAGTHEDKSAVPEWLTGLQWGGSRSNQFEHCKPTPGLEAKNLPVSVRKILKGHSLLTRRAFLHLHNAGLMRLTEMRKDHLKILAGMNEPKRLDILEQLYEKLRADRSRGGKSHEVLSHLLKLDDHRQKLDENRKAKKTNGKVRPAQMKAQSGALDGHSFSRNYVLAVLAQRGRGKVKAIINIIDKNSAGGGDWQRQVRAACTMSKIDLAMNDVQLSLLRWVLEGMSWDLVKIGKAIKSLRAYGIVYDTQFINALGLLGENTDIEKAESLYIRLTEKNGDSRISYMGLSKLLEADRNAKNLEGNRVLENDEYGKNWVDQMDVKKPLWLKVESEEVQYAKAARRRGRKDTKFGDDAKTMLYERSQIGHSKFGGSVYGPRMVDHMDDFTKASIRAGVDPKTMDKLAHQANVHHKH